MPLVSLSEVSIHAGYVEKLPVSKRGLGSWRRRYLVLVRNQLEWHAEQPNEQRLSEDFDTVGDGEAALYPKPALARKEPPLGTLPLDHEAVVDRGTAGCICVRTASQSLWIRAPHTELEHWAEAINGVLAQLRPMRVYSDSFVEVRQDALVIRCYWFPSGAPKLLPVGEIREVDVRPELWMGPHTRWGLGGPSVWWACDTRLSRANGCVVIRSDSLFRHGFSCDDRAKLTEALRGVLAAERASGGQPVTWAGEDGEGSWRIG